MCKFTIYIVTGLFQIQFQINEEDMTTMFNVSPV